jgi:hypothetical protein
VHLQGDGPDPSDATEYVLRAERRYRAVVGPDHEIVKKELALLKSIADEIEARLPADLPEGEQIRRGIQIAAADPDLSKRVVELEELAELRDGPALWQKAGSER